MNSESAPSSSAPAKRSLLKSSAIVSSMTMMSRVLGLIRDIVFARFIGAGDSADAFYIAFKVPNFLRRLFAEGAFSQAFIPVLSEYRANGSEAAIRHFIDRVAGCLGVSLIIISAAVVLASPVFTAFFAVGFLINDIDKFWLTADLIRITFPYLLLISLTGFAGAILNSYDRFAVPAFTPLLLNVSLIIAAAIVSPMFDEPVFALAWGVLAAGVIQLLFQIPFLMRLGLMPHPKVDWADESVRKVLKLMAPAVFAVSVSQINLLFDTILASNLPTGSPSWLYFSDRLVELPLGVFGIAIATVILPTLSRQFTEGADRFSETLDWALRMILFIAIPSAIALVILAEPLLFTFLHYGKITERDVLMSSYSLQAYALGLVAFMLIKALVSGFFSRQDMKTPMKIGVIAMVSNMVFNVLLLVPLHIFWKLGHVGLALATACSAFINAGLLFRRLRKDGVYTPHSGWLRFAGQAAFANILMMFVLLWLNGQLGGFVDLNWYERCLNLAVLVGGGGGVYLAALLVAGVRMKDIRIHL